MGQAPSAGHIEQLRQPLACRPQERIELFCSLFSRAPLRVLQGEKEERRGDNEQQPPLKAPPRFAARGAGGGRRRNIPGCAKGPWLVSLLVSGPRHHGTIFGSGAKILSRLPLRVLEARSRGGHFNRMRPHCPVDEDAISSRGPRLREQQHERKTVAGQPGLHAARVLIY